MNENYLDMKIRALILHQIFKKERALNAFPTTNNTINDPHWRLFSEFIH